MSNLRILKKRDGSQVVQELHNKPCCGGEHQPFWLDLKVPIVEESKPEKSLAQVLYETLCGGKASNWEKFSYRNDYEATAQAAMDYLEKEGWRRPNE